jgi:uncharacterized membrane protein
MPATIRAELTNELEINVLGLLKNIQLLYVLPLAGLGYALFNSWKRYSFWSDELGSVSMSVLPLKEVMSAIAGDVHPPLFQLLMKVWVVCFGTDEPIVRLLSLLSCLLAALYLFYRTKDFSKVARWAVITIFTTCSLFPFYAQEARSYGVTLLLSTVLAVEFVSIGKGIPAIRSYYLTLTAIALSLTHYFGLLLSLSMLTVLVIEHRKTIEQRSVFSVGIVLCFVWPAVHYWLGLAALKSSKNSWMIVDGPLDTTRIFLRTFFPNLNDTLLLFCACCLIFLIVYSVSICKKNILGSVVVSSGLYKLVLVTSLMLFGIATIDAVSPISTERNFIVMLPVVSLLVGYCAQQVFYQKNQKVIFIIFIGVIVWAANSLIFTNYLLALKWAPQQNWRATAQFVIDNRKSQGLYYLRARDDEETDRVFNFYIKKLSANTLTVERKYIEQIADINGPAFIILGGANQGLFDMVKKHSTQPVLQIFQPTQSLNATTGVIEF